MSRLLVALIASALILLTIPTSAATPTHHNGRPGPASFTDAAGSPGARCSFAKTTGGMPLARINVRPVIVYGNLGDRLQAVGIRVRLQHREDGAWVNRAKGKLEPGKASRTKPVSLDPSFVAVPSLTNDTGPWRSIVKVLWWNRDSSLRGSRTYLIDHYQTLIPGSRGPERVVRSICKPGLAMIG